MPARHDLIYFLSTGAPCALFRNEIGGSFSRRACSSAETLDSSCGSASVWRVNLWSPTVYPTDICRHLRWQRADAVACPLEERYAARSVPEITSRLVFMAQQIEVSSPTNSSITYLTAPIVADIGLAYHLFVCFTGFGLRQTICSFAITHLHPYPRSFPMHNCDQKTEASNVSGWIGLCLRGSAFAETFPIPAVSYVSE